jgi:hypothetical protein
MNESEVKKSEVCVVNWIEMEVPRVPLPATQRPCWPDRK